VEPTPPQACQRQLHFTWIDEYVNRITLVSPPRSQWHNYLGILHLYSIYFTVLNTAWRLPWGSGAQYVDRDLPVDLKVTVGRSHNAPSAPMDGHVRLCIQTSITFSVLDVLQRNCKKNSQYIYWEIYILHFRSRSFWLDHFISCSHAERVWAPLS